MFKKPTSGPKYYEEVPVSNKNIIIFCVVIALITIGIIVFTGFLAYKMIQDSKVVPEDLSQYSTVGKKTEEEPKNNRTRRTVSPSKVPSEEPTEEPSEVPSEEPKSTQVQRVSKVTSNFPKHDHGAAIESQLPTYSDEIAKKVVNVYYEEAKKVFLTFDDGPSQNTQAILDILDKYDVKATFFVMGANVDAKPNLVKEEYEKGHFIANHSYTHQYSQLYASEQSILDEYNRCNTAIQNAIGVSTYNPHLFRYPGGATGGPYNDVKQSAISLLRDNQITYTNWNCMTGDAAGSTTIEQMWATLNESSAGDDNLVILMHDAGDKQMTVEFLPQLIEHYKDLGYEFCTYYDIMCE